MMRRNLHRIFTGFTTSSLYLFMISQTIYPGIYNHINDNILQIFYGLWGLLIVYWGGCFLWALSKLVRLRHARKIPWLLIMIVLPFIGVFLYYEKAIYKATPRLVAPSDELQSRLFREANQEDATTQLLWKRTVASVIDYSILGFLLVVILHFDGGGAFVFDAMKHPVLIIILWIFVLPFGESRTGQTLGKRTMNLVVLNRKGNYPRLIEAIVRHLFDILDVISWGVLSITSRGKALVPRRLGDYFANTWVLRNG